MTLSILLIVLLIVLGTLALSWSFYRRQQFKHATEPGRSSHSVPLSGKHLTALRIRLGYALVALSFSGLTLLLGSQPHALAASTEQLSNVGSFLTTGQYLSSGDYMESDNGQYFAIMQSDGNFVVYHGTGPSNNLGLVWASGTGGRPTGAFFAIMQGNGEFVIYRGTGPSNNLGYVWSSSHTALPTGQYFAIMQDDANFVVYHGTGPSNNLGLVWATNTYLSSTIVAGNHQTHYEIWQDGCSQACALFAPLQVKVSYANGRLASNVNVSFKVGSAPAGMWIQYSWEVFPTLPWTATVTTDANGIATLSWLDQLDNNLYSVDCYNASGSFTIVASPTNGGQVTFNETA